MSHDEGKSAAERIEELLARAGADGGVDCNELFGAVYPEFRRVAQNLMRNERRDHTLQPTALVHEAYMRIGDKLGGTDHELLIPLVARAMRRVLIDHGRKKRSGKRGGGAGRVAFEEVEELLMTGSQLDLEDLNEALDRLHEDSVEYATAIEMCFFLGMSSTAAGQVLGVSSRTVENRISVAKAVLRRHLKGYEPEDDTTGEDAARNERAS